MPVTEDPEVQEKQLANVRQKNYRKKERRLEEELKGEENRCQSLELEIVVFCQGKYQIFCLLYRMCIINNL